MRRSLSRSRLTGAWPLCARGRRTLRVGPARRPPQRRAASAEGVAGARYASTSRPLRRSLRMLRRRRAGRSGVAVDWQEAPRRTKSTTPPGRDEEDEPPARLDEQAADHGASRKAGEATAPYTPSAWLRCCSSASRDEQGKSRRSQHRGAEPLDGSRGINSLGSTARPPEMLASTKMQSPIRYRPGPAKHVGEPAAEEEEAAKLTAYRLTNHCSDVVATCKPCPIEGSATLTIVKSSTTMNWAMAKVANRTVPLFGAPVAALCVFSDEGRSCLRCSTRWHLLCCLPETN